jgi:hypothetical protein
VSTETHDDREIDTLRPLDQLLPGTISLGDLARSRKRSRIAVRRLMNRLGVPILKVLGDDIISIEAFAAAVRLETPKSRALPRHKRLGRPRATIKLK